MSLRQNLKQIKPRQQIKRYNQSSKTWRHTKERQPVGGELPVTECRQKNKSLFMT